MLLCWCRVAVMLWPCLCCCGDVVLMVMLRWLCCYICGVVLLCCDDCFQCCGNTNTFVCIGINHQPFHHSFILHSESTSLIFF